MKIFFREKTKKKWNNVPKTLTSYVLILFPPNSVLKRQINQLVSFSLEGFLVCQLL